jgi:hypothetical protein
MVTIEVKDLVRQVKEVQSALTLNKLKRIQGMGFNIL